MYYRNLWIVLLAIFLHASLLKQIQPKPALEISPIEVPDHIKKIDAFIENEISCLAKNIYFEARGESFDGQVAVAHVTKNRVQSNKYPRSYCGVVWEGSGGPLYKCQFSWTCDGKSDRIKDHRSYRVAYRIARKVFAGELTSPRLNRNVLHYHAVYVEPEWSLSLKRIVRIGSHVFYV